MSANIDNSGICVHRHEAYADVTPTEYGYQFLEAIAGEAGLSVNDTVATVTGVTASATGMVIANSTGIVFGASGNKSLDNLAEAADYPAWDTLNSEQQQSWVSKDNYDAAKFNALLDAFGLNQDRDRFYSSGGANFEFSQESIDQIKRLGRIGSRWASSIGVTLSDITSAVLDRNKILAWFPASTGNNLVFNGSEVSGWPSDYPENVNYIIGSSPYGCYYRNGEYMWLYTDMSSPVYGVIWAEDKGTYTNFRLDAFSKSPFTLKGGNLNVANPNPSYLTELTAYTASYQGETFYYSYSSLPSLNGYVGCFGATPNLVTPTIRTEYMGAILFNEQQSGGSSSDVEEVPEYPEDDINPDTVIYYPNEGVSPSVDWPKYIEIQRPDNDYNPDNQTGKDEWKQETKQNVIPLQNIRFDKLFPFCLMTDVKDLTEKIEETITPGQQSNYLTIRIPMAYASNGADTSSEDIELDGTPVRDLLVMVRPFNQVLLLFFMVFSLVMFWKSILTGD